MGPWKISLVFKGAIFHFHDYGREGSCKHVNLLILRF